MAAAAMFSSRCATEDVPGIGSITGEREQPGQRDLGRRPPRRVAPSPGARPAERTAAERSPRQERDALGARNRRGRPRTSRRPVEVVLDRDDGVSRRPPELLDASRSRRRRDGSCPRAARLDQRADRTLRTGTCGSGRVELVEVDPRRSRRRRRLPSQAAPRSSGRPSAGQPPSPAGRGRPSWRSRSPSGYGWSASAIRRSLTFGP